MYIKGVSTRDAEAVMKEFGIESLSSSQVSRATKLLDDELEAWRNRSLGEVRHLIVDARYEKFRFGWPEIRCRRDRQCILANVSGNSFGRRLLNH